MDTAAWFNPFVQAGQEIRIEIDMLLSKSRLGELSKRVGRVTPPVLPEMRVDEASTVGQRKSELFLQTVRHGANRS